MATGSPQPIDDRIQRYGRRVYSRFGLEYNVYGVPVDDTEQDRSERFDEVLREYFFNDTVLVQGFPIGQTGNDEDSPVVLDCGCAGGAWITQFLDDRDGDVTGVDVFFGRPNADDDDDDEPEEDDDDDDPGVQEYVKRRWNLNASFSEAPREYELRPETFDLINSRMLAEGIQTNRWSTYLRELRMMLKHGAWLQVVEMQLHIQSWNGRLPPEACLTRWWNLYRQAGERMNRNPRVGLELGRLLTQAELGDVRHWSIDVPIGTWNDRFEQAGREVLPLVRTMLQSLSLFPFLRVLRIEPSTYRALILGALAELDRADHYKLYFKVHVATGRRRTKR